MSKRSFGLSTGFAVMLAIVAASILPARSAISDIPGPPGSVAFGSQVAVLPNGNIVVTDVRDPAGGAAYLYSPAGTQISKVTGITVNQTSFAEYDRVKIVVLKSGNYLLVNPSWSGTAPQAGMVAWASGNTGISGVISSANALVGGQQDDQVGFNGITLLKNGNYVVGSWWWRNGTLDRAGAATWGNGSSGTVGLVSSANSLVGTHALEYLGSRIYALTNGNYVVMSMGYVGATAEVGAATWGNGTSGVKGAVTAANSLMGSHPDDGDYATFTALANGNYVVAYPYWDNGSIVDAGAAVFGNGSTGTKGTISAANALVGAQSGNFVGYPRVVALTNGNYVVGSSDWEDGTAQDLGAATWGNGTTGTVGTVSRSNSLVGSKNNQYLGDDWEFEYTGIVALSNGNYLVGTPRWSSASGVDQGAVTWGKGINGGVIGVVSASNSLVGRSNDDRVGQGAGGQGLLALSNGNYVVLSYRWKDSTGKQQGAVTWGNGTLVRTGVVDQTNSVFGLAEATALANGNYVAYRNGFQGQIGAVRWLDGAAASSGPVTPENSYSGTSAYPHVGSPIALPDGNYVLCNPFWGTGTQYLGGASWANGSIPLLGAPSAENALVGTTASDDVCSGGIVEGGNVHVYSDGNYLIESPDYDSGATWNAGAITLGNGPIKGTIPQNSSVIGTQIDHGTQGTGQLNLFASYDLARHRAVIGQPGENKFSFLSAPAASSQLSISDLRIAEGASGSRVAYFTASLSSPLPNDVTFTATSSNGTAAAGSDYLAFNQPITIPAGQLTQVVPVTVYGDGDYEGNETINVNLGNVSGAALFDGHAVGTLLNDDPDPTPTIYVARTQVMEGDAGTTKMYVQIVLSAPAPAPVSFTASTSNALATAGTDYVARTQNITIPAGGVGAVFVVDVLADTAYEFGEFFQVKLSNVTGARIGADVNDCLIWDEDWVPSGQYPVMSLSADMAVMEGNAGTKTVNVTVSLPAPAPWDVVFDLATSNGGAFGGSDFGSLNLVGQKIPAGKTSATFAVTINGDTTPELGEYFYVVATNFSNTADSIKPWTRVTIANDDAAVVPPPLLSVGDVVVTEGNSGTKSASFTVQLSKAATTAVGFNLTTSNGTATAGSDYVALALAGQSIPAGETSKSFAVTINGDTTSEPDETFNLAISNVTGASVADGDAVGTISNDDVALPTLSIGDVSVTEGNAGTRTATFTVQLSKAAPTAVGFNLSTSNGTASAGSDYVALALNGQSIAAGASSKSFAVTVNGDTLVEPDETFNLAVSNVSGATVADGSAVGTISNDDSSGGGLPTLSIGDVSIIEGDSLSRQAVFTLTLSAPSSAAVTYDVATANGTATAGTDYTAKSLSAQTIAAGTTATTVTVTVKGDMAVEPDETFTVNVTNVTGATVADGNGIGTIIDDDGASLTVSRLDTRGLYDDLDDGNRAPLLGSDEYALLLSTNARELCAKAGGTTVVAVDGVESLAVLRELADEASLACGRRRYAAVLPPGPGTDQVGFLVDQGQPGAPTGVEVSSFEPARGAARIASITVRVPGAALPVTLLAAGGSTAQARDVEAALQRRVTGAAGQALVVISPTPLRTALHELSAPALPGAGVVAERVYVSPEVLQDYPSARVRSSRPPGAASPILFLDR